MRDPLDQWPRVVVVEGVPATAPAPRITVEGGGTRRPSSLADRLLAALRAFCVTDGSRPWEDATAVSVTEPQVSEVARLAVGVGHALELDEPVVRRVEELARRPHGRFPESASLHERWDGRGQPKGLAGTAIPLESRIVRACQALVTTADARESGTVRTREHALEKLERAAGAELDPGIVRILTRLLGPEHRLDPDDAADPYRIAVSGNTAPEPNRSSL